MSTTEIVEVQRRPLTPLDIGETKAAQKLYQDGLTQLLDRAEDVTPIRGRGGKVKNHVNRSGVSKITTWCSLSTTLVDTVVERDEDGKPLRWRVTVRATAPDGRVSDGVGAFDVKERPSSKPEHDGLGTAFTRARNRAVMDLVGMGEVSAEEMVDGGAVASGTELPYGPEATLDLMMNCQEAIPLILPGVPGDDAVALLAKNFGYLPEIACRTIMGMKWLQVHPPVPDPNGASAPATDVPSKAPVGPPKGKRGGKATPSTPKAPSAARGRTAKAGKVSPPPEAEVVEDDLDEVDIDSLLDNPQA